MALSVHPRILIASDSFKGTLSSAQVAEIVSEELLAAMPRSQVQSLALGDGGEGTLEVFARTEGSERKNVQVHDPLGKPRKAEFVLLAGQDGSRIAFVEAAEANGLNLVPHSERNPLMTSSYGVGELICAALDAGATELGIGLGGSATNDGGMGCMRALGVRFLDAGGSELEGRGGDLSRLASLDVSRLDERIHGCAIRAMCDVSNPLLGPQGATFVFGPQKGATNEQLAELEQGMGQYARLAARDLGSDYADVPGTGAAGGLGFALHAFLGAQLASGIDVVLDLVGFDEALAQADLCITGEGYLDAQTADGKLVSGIARRCKQAGLPCLCICGAADADAASRGLPGLSCIVPTVDSSSPEDREPTSELAAHRLRSCARRVFAELAAGKELRDVC